MKRVLSLVLALVMVLGTMPMAFAADKTAGEELQAYGVIQGDKDGNLMEDKGLTRAELAKLVCVLNGAADDAAEYSKENSFEDVSEDDWYASYVAYAVMKGWFNGVTETEFAPAGAVSEQMMATVMLRVLGQEPVWETAVAEATSMGLLKDVDADDDAAMVRGEVFKVMTNTLQQEKKGEDVALGTSLELDGFVVEEEEVEAQDLVAEIDFAKAFANNKVNVDFKDDVDAAAAGQVANYTIVEKADTTKEIAVIAVVVENGDDVALETEALTAGKAYTVMVGDSKANFAGVKKDTKAPKLDSVKGSDTNEVEVVFEEMVDRATAEDVANYTFDKEGTTVKAELDEDRDTVTLTVEGMTSSKSQMITVQNVTNVDGVVMSKSTRSFGPKFDKSAPKLDDVKASAHNNVEVVVEFDDDHGVDQATAEDVSNYSIDGLEIISAKATYINSDDKDDYYDKVILTTSEQTKSKRYELKVSYMVDGSTSANATTKVLKEKFTGGTKDDDKPKVDDAKERNLSEILVTFEEENALDPATALDAGNYTFKDDKLDVLSVRFDDEDTNGNTYDVGETGLVDSTKKPIINEDNDKIKVILTVSDMEEDETYKLYVNNISDNFGNTMDKADDENIRIKDEITTYAQIVDVKSTDLEKITVVFNMEVYEASAEDPTNYVIDNGIGAVKKATWNSDNEKEVTLEVPKLTENKTYEIVVNNVENTWGYSTDDSKKKFIATNDEVDTERPEVDDVDYDFHGEVRVTFTEGVDVETSGSSQAIMKAVDGTEFKAVAVLGDNDEIVVFDAYSAIDGSDSTAVNTKQNETYTIKEFKFITDDSGNTLDYTSGDEDFTTASDTFADDGGIDKDFDSEEKVTNDGVSQENGNVIHATFDREIKLVGGTTVQASYYAKSGDANYASTGVYTFDAEVDEDDDKLLILTLKGTNDFPEDEVELRFNFAGALADLNGIPDVDTLTAGEEASDGGYSGAVVADLLGRTACNKLVKVDVDNDDDVEPTLTEVEVVDIRTLNLHFDEKLKSTGTYKIHNDDEDEWITASADWDDADVKDIVVLTLNKDLAIDNYTLSYKTSPRDLAGNKVEDEDDTFSFIGVTTAKAVKMVAAKVVNPLKFKIVNDVQKFKTDDRIELKRIVDGSEVTILNKVDISTVSAWSLNGDKDVLTVALNPFNALLEKLANNKTVTYRFTVYPATGTTAYSLTTQTFTGQLAEEDATYSTSTTEAATAFITTGVPYDADSYEYYLVDASDTTYADGFKCVAADTTASNEIVISEINNFIKLKEDASGVLTDATKYKLVVYRLDDGERQGVEYVTESFTWPSH